MLKIGLRVLQLLTNRHVAGSTTNTSSSLLDFSSSANSGYRGFFF